MTADEDEVVATKSPLDELDALVLERYFAEADSPTLSTFELRSSSKTLSAKDIAAVVEDAEGDEGCSNNKNGGGNENDETTAQATPPVLLSLLEEWRNLISILKKEQIFTHCVESLSAAFNGTIRMMQQQQQQQQQNGVAGGAGEEQEDGNNGKKEMSPSSQVFRHMTTLVSLMSRTASAAADATTSGAGGSKRAGSSRRRGRGGGSDDAAVAASAECRFVTLLEVLLSHCGGGGSSSSSSWSPSDGVRQVWMDWQQPEIPKDLPAVNFRRKAYRVLVSLPWVPSSRGLLEACSFDVRRHAVAVRQCPPKVRKYFDRVRAEKPQPRYDCVSRVLNQLKDCGDQGGCIVIHSDEQGVGKTTLAALVVSHPSILSMYRVLWLTLPEKQLTYETYTKCLDDLCEQLSIPPGTIQWPECVERFEEPALHRLREDAAMEQARDKFAEELLDRQQDEKYLLVMDDVENEKEIDLFAFSDRQATIATTISDVDDFDTPFKLEISPMCDEELIDLFLTEANFPPSHVLGLTAEVRSVIKKCDHHPLTVRTVGRWYGLKRVTAGTVDGLDELLDELSTIVFNNAKEFQATSSAGGNGNEKGSPKYGASHKAGDDPVGVSDSETEPSSRSEQQQQKGDLPEKENQKPEPNEGDTEDVTEVDEEGLENGSTRDEKKVDEDDQKFSLPVLFDILNRFLLPTNTEGESASMLFTLCIASMVVVFPEGVPLDSVILLWEQLLLVDSDAMNEISLNRDASHADIRKRAGLVAEGLSYMGFLSIVDKNGNPWVEVHHKFYKKFAMHLARETLCGGERTYEKTSEEWNKAFVTAYFTHRLEGMSDRDDDLSWEYAVLKLPSHTYRARMFAMAETVLGEEPLFRARIDAVGWDRTIDMQIKDCIDLQRALEKRDLQDSDSHSKTAQAISPVFKMLSTMATTNAPGVLGLPEDKLVIEVARVLYKIGFGLASNGRFDEAVEQFESALNLAPQSDELVASILYGGGWVQLAANMSEKAIKKLKVSRKVMEEYGRTHVLYKEVLRLYGEALIGECEYREAAELLQDLVFWLKSDAANNKIELGTSLSKMGRLQYMMGDDERAREAFNDCLMWKLEAGENSADLSLALTLLGDMNVDKQDLADARRYYERALQILDSLGIDPDDAEHSLLRAKLDYLKGDFSVSLESLETARQIISQSPVLFLDQSAYDLRCIARCYYAEGELAATTSVLQDSLILTNQRPFSLERSYGLHDLAKCILDQSMTREALVLLEQSLEIRILKLGECPLVMDTFHMIGKVHMLLGSPDEALTVFQKVSELTNRLTPDDHARVAKVLYSIGDATAAKRDYSEAKAKILGSMSLLDESGSHDSPDVARALHRLGDIETAEKQLPVANEYYTEALRIRKMHTDKRETAETLHSLGVLNRKRKNLDSALESLLESLCLRREIGSVKDTARTVMELAHVYRLRSEMDDAVRSYEECLELLGDGDDCANERGSAYLSLGHAKLSLKRDGEVLECYERALETRMETLGRDNMRTANVHRSLGLFQYLVLHGDEALLHLNEYMRVTELDDGDDHYHDDYGNADVDYVVALTLMFDIHRASGRETQAKNLIELAKEVCDDSEEVRSDLPAIIETVNQRKAAPARLDSSSSSKKGGLFARLANTLVEESGNQLAVSAKDSAVLRNIGFVDD